MLNQRLCFFLVLTLSLTALAEEAEPAKNRRMAPANVDLRLAGDTDFLLTSLDVGAALDVGLFRVGPGTVGLGASLDYGICFSVCWGLGALLNLDVGRNFLSTLGRLSYHFDLPGNASRLETVDVYAVAMAGLVSTRMHIASRDDSIRYEGSDAALGLGIGAGMNYFFTERFYFGGEGRLRFAAGRYTETLRVGDATAIQENAEVWALTPLNVQFFVGLRI